MKKIPENYKVALKPYFSDEILGYPYIVVCPFLFKIIGEYSGLTLKKFIFLQKDIPNELSINRLRLIAHELVHVVQQQKTFLIWWLIKYGYWYVRNRIKGKNHTNAYYEIPFEKEAYKLSEDMITA